VVAEVVRSGFVEGRHHGSVVGLDASGAVVLAVGDPRHPVFPRSSSKPMQAVGMVRAGLDVDGELLALVVASHSGEPHHLDGVRRILGAAGLTPADLRTPADLPLGEAERRSWVREGRGPEPLAMNCSGKHAGMLATCVANGWPVAGYLSAESPLQRGLLASIEDLTEEPVAAEGVDGCGAPVLAMSLVGLARAFRRLATSPPGTAEARVAAAMSSYPEFLGGTGRDVTRFTQALPGAVAKDGAEGVYALALPDGRAVALKVDDGSQRARGPILVAALRRLGVGSEELDQIADMPLLGGGVRVGGIRAAL
jgi:L-asparaginase II